MMNLSAVLIALPKVGAKKRRRITNISCVKGFLHNAYEFKRGFATGCFGHRVFLVTHDAVKYSNGH